LSWINRFVARIGSSAAAAALTLLATRALPACADAPLTALYQEQPIRFTHVAEQSGALAIGLNDPGFRTLLHDTGSLLTWKSGERYILITTSAPTVVSFAVGDRRYDVGPISLQASFAPYERENEAYLPFAEVLRALDLALRQDGGEKILQPQLASLDVRQESNRVSLFAHAGAPVQARVVRQSATAITYAFDGVGTSLVGTRRIGQAGVRNVDVDSAGTVRAPTTLVTVSFDAGTVAQPPQNSAERDVSLAFDLRATAAPAAVALESSTPQPASSTNGPALVTAVTAQPASDGASVTIAVNGDATYEWHRLRDPDNRFWIDIKNAQLQGPPVEEPAPNPVISVRVRQDDSTTVRVALSLDGPKTISFEPSATGLTIDVGTEDVADAPRSGNGSIGQVVSSSAQSVTAVTPAPLEPSPSDFGSSDQPGWKFGARSSYVPTNPRLIVIDPGHGGSDRGTFHGGVAEADLTLDMAKRLREILIARGWEVKLTRETDVDVYAPNDSPRDELQTRDDIANKAGARLFLSIHANAFINSGPYGTTYYVSKPDDLALARALERDLANDGTKDDGIVKSHMYVTLHARMPAVLIETAFLSNPSDYALLTSAAWRQKVAQEIADGIAEYAQEYPARNQPAQ